MNIFRIMLLKSATSELRNARPWLPLPPSPLPSPSPEGGVEATKEKGVGLPDFAAPPELLTPARPAPMMMMRTTASSPLPNPKDKAIVEAEMAAMETTVAPGKDRGGARTRSVLVKSNYSREFIGNLIAKTLPIF